MNNKKIAFGDNFDAIFSGWKTSSMLFQIPYHKKGFTLIEVMIATAIMVSVLGALVYALTQNSNLTETTRNQDIALNAVQEKLEEYANSPNLLTDEHTESFAVAGLTAPAGQSYPGSLSVNRVVGTDLYDVRVTVTWQQRGGRQISRTLTTTFKK